MQGQKFSMRKLIQKSVKQPMDQRFDIEIPTNYTVKSPLEAWHLASIIFFARSDADWYLLKSCINYLMSLGH